jgi:hypothetical protein
MDIIGVLALLCQGLAWGQAPTVVSAVPASGSGLTQDFSFWFTDANGVSDLTVLNVLINGALDGARACYLAYDRPSNNLYLVSDAGTAIAGIQLNGSGQLANGQCTVDGSRSSAAAAGVTLTLSLRITFNQANFSGDKTVYLAARDASGGNSGWQIRGAYRVTPPAPTFPSTVSLNPPYGFGTRQQFIATYQDASSTANLGSLQLLFSNALDGRAACYLGYDAVNNLLYLVNDSGSALLPAIVPTLGNQSVENSQCRVDGAGTMVVNAGPTLSLTVNLTFKGAFAGPKVVYTGVQTRSSGNSGWQSMGTWLVPPPGQSNVLTYHNDLARTGQNLNETALTAANVNSTLFGKKFSYSVDGQVYAQPLYMAGVPIPGKGVHNVVFVVTEHNSAYAFDADSNAGANSDPLWKVSYINAGAGITSVPSSDVSCTQITPELGISGAPVIDPQTLTMYFVVMTKEVTGTQTRYFQRLHAVDVTTGGERPGSPVAIQASYPGTSEGGNTVTLNPKAYKSRMGVALRNGIVYTFWASHCDIGTYHGWVIAYDAYGLQQLAVYNSTPNGNGASFWSSNATPPMDSSGFLYLMGGNGSFNPAQNNLGESLLKLAPNGLQPVDYFTPFNFQTLNDGDVDLGSGGPMVLPDWMGNTSHPHLVVGAGKEGRIYLLDRNNLGQFRSGSDSQIVQSIVGQLGAMFSMPAMFKNWVYFSSVSFPLRAFSMSNGLVSSTASSQSATAFIYPGTVPSVSANDVNNGIVWVIENGGNAVLRAYSAANLAVELYNSTQAPGNRDVPGGYVKFTVPTIASGKVFVGTQNSLAIFGLL